MEKITCICVMRELMMALSDFENKLMDTHGVSLNEAMVLCALGGECITASVIAERTGLRPSHTSKVIGSLEFAAVSSTSGQSTATAYGLLRGTIGLVLVFVTNKIAKNSGNEGIM